MGDESNSFIDLGLDTTPCGQAVSTVVPADGSGMEADLLALSALGDQEVRFVWEDGVVETFTLAMDVRVDAFREDSWPDGPTALCEVQQYVLGTWALTSASGELDLSGELVSILLRPDRLSHGETIDDAAVIAAVKARTSSDFAAPLHVNVSLTPDRGVLSIQGSPPDPSADYDLPLGEVETP